MMMMMITFFHGATASSLSRLHTQTHTTVGRTLLDEGSARPRDLYLTHTNTHKRQISMPSAGFEPTIPASKRPQTHALDCAATGIGDDDNSDDDDGDYYYDDSTTTAATTATITTTTTPPPPTTTTTTTTTNNNNNNNNKTVRKGAKNGGNLRRLTIFEEVEGGEM
jgi:hypothetical protein